MWGIGFEEMAFERAGATVSPALADLGEDEGQPAVARERKGRRV